MSELPNTVRVLRPSAPACGPDDPLPAGHAVEDCAIESVLGRGAFGYTYLARERHSASPVVVREYLPQGIAVRSPGGTVVAAQASTEAAFRAGLDHFVAEARALASIRQHGIVRGLGFYAQHDTGYFAMEHVAGESLRAWSSRNRTPDRGAVETIAAGLVDAAAALHDAGHLHRAITPDSVRIRDDGTPVLLDLGGARRMKEVAAGNASAVLAAPGYAPIEICLGGEAEGPWTDVYSVAALLYLLVTGRRPMSAVARTRFDAMPPAAGTAEAGPFTAVMLAAIDRGLAARPGGRPRTAREFRAGLFGTPVAAEPQLAPPAAAPAPAPPALQTRASLAEQQASNSAVYIDPALLAAVERLLASHVGPIAAVLVKRAARGARNIEGVVNTLAADIAEAPVQRRFVESAKDLLGAGRRAPPPPVEPATTGSPGATPAPGTGAAPADAVPDAALDALVAAYARHIGPLARVLVRKAAARTRDRSELLLLLAEHIPDPAQQRAWVREGMETLRALR